MGAVAWAMLLGGAVMVGWGAWLVGPALGLIATGGLLIGGSLLLSWLAE